MWNFKDHNINENILWCKLRSIEWRGLPFFISQALIPILSVFFPFLYLFLISVFLSIIWTVFLIKTKYVNLQISTLFMYIVIYLKWPLCIAFAIYFSIRANYPYSLIICLWPYLAGMFGGQISGLTSGLMGIRDFNSVILNEFIEKLTASNME